MPNACGAEWRQRKPEDDKYGMEHGEPECNYCGSLHPDAAVKFLQTPGTRFSGSDWKYGWPHKFYIEPPSPTPDRQVRIGSRNFRDGFERNDPRSNVDGSGPNDYWSCFAHHESPCGCPKEPRVTGNWNEAILGTRTHLRGKFYNEHLKDASPETFAKFAELSEKIFGITWGKDDEKGVFYRAPKSRSFYGFQRAGSIQSDGTPLHTL